MNNFKMFLLLVPFFQFSSSFAQIQDVFSKAGYVKCSSLNVERAEKTDYCVGMNGDLRSVVKEKYKDNDDKSKLKIKTKLASELEIERVQNAIKNGAKIPAQQPLELVAVPNYPGVKVPYCSGLSADDTSTYEFCLGKGSQLHRVVKVVKSEGLFQKILPKLGREKYRVDTREATAADLEDFKIKHKDDSSDGKDKKPDTGKGDGGKRLPPSARPEDPISDKGDKPGDDQKEHGSKPKNPNPRESICGYKASSPYPVVLKGVYAQPPYNSSSAAEEAGKKIYKELGCQDVRLYKKCDFAYLGGFMPSWGCTFISSNCCEASWCKGEGPGHNVKQKQIAKSKIWPKRDKQGNPLIMPEGVPCKGKECVGEKERPYYDVTQVTKEFESDGKFSVCVYQPPSSENPSGSGDSKAGK